MLSTGRAMPAVAVGLLRAADTSARCFLMGFPASTLLSTSLFPAQQPV